ncbi:MAG: carboxypeptidase-like regulatory domain-containing protein [Bacteroidota bacterium]|jgi:CarboxypepD_reg-like domain/TonB-dependent Receptor Plug Domain
MTALSRLLTGFLLLFCATVMAQEAKVHGFLNDSEGKPLEFANIAVKGTTTGTSTSKDGSYELSVPAGKDIVLLFSSVGFATDSVRMNLKKGEKRLLNRQLKPSSTQLSTIEVKDQQLRTNTFSRLDPKAISYIPTINASVEDLIKTMPGVSSRNELSSQYSVRGGNFDENLVFVNDIEIYRPYLVRAGQQEGQSFLNPDLVSGISFSAGGFDAKYGDKMSSVLDVKYKKPTQFAASFEASLLGATAHVEGKIARKLAYLFGVRYKTNTYLLNSLDTKGNYKPRFFDVQGMLYYDFSSKWELSVFGSYTANAFKLIPQSQTTTFGSDAVTAYQVKIFFDGQENDHYENWLASATLTFKPNDHLRLKLMGSAYQTWEAQTYDISGEYWLGQVELTGKDAGNLIQLLGVGAYLDHARDYLDGTVYNIEHRGSYEQGRSQMLWGIKYQHDLFSYTMNEWQMLDSAGYSLPRPQDSLGKNPPPHGDFYLSDVLKATGGMSTNKGDAFIQNTWTFKNQKNDIGLTAGARFIYSDYNGQFLFNPRANFSFKPHWKKEMVFRISGGVYSQPPTFREMTDLQGLIVPGLKAQTSYQGVAGSDLYFSMWHRPFKLVAEVYYKYIQDLIPYEIDNLRIRYYGTNDAHGYAGGIDFRINGEFVKGAESWASLSLMRTEEYFQGHWVPRPTDQRFNLSIFFQDYIPGFPTWKVAITLVYGSGLPYGAPDSPRYAQTYRMPPYRRVDIGLSKQLIGEYTHFSGKNPLRAFKSLWVGLDVFNLFDFANTVSYQWITDVQGRQYNVPNYLTPRLFNLKLVAAF